MTPSHHLAIALSFLILGTCVGSFLNVCVYRIPIGLSVLRPRSRCPRCQAAIRASDNLPVLGWLILRGRCRHCGAPISPRYPLVELTVGLLFAGSYLAEVALVPGDLWEDTSLIGVLVLLLVPWVMIALIVVGTLIGYDSRGDSARLTRGRGIRRQEKALAGHELVGVGKPITVELDDLVGTAGISEPVTRDAPERLETLDDMNR